MNASVHFQGFPLLNLLSRNTSESLWRECGAQNEVLARMMDGTGTDELTQIFTHPSPLQENTTTLLWNTGFIRAHRVFSYYCYYLACSAYLDWVTEVLFHSGRSLKGARDWSCPGELCRWPWHSPAPLLESSSTAHAVSHACTHPARDLPEIIDRNTSSYITILMCPCGGEHAITLGWLTASQSSG